ncbi:hypothetical protein BN159_4206 [Streptomyces davaonensis JCM 4913]|uniref:DUF3592 domain-containing protein n=1 Tax=Streptomyces davaonensis (strain DSM 101723 / JCM 4913 / KCC S-0913 / 768) TaxID=1214101 RepID=K4R674_STRDJ|nr:hypothetical protein [Streptomyces davaonensis]CCK28585.1 hypothetical protein BN159_4206 [Streptomyces davaonensis JCM 4913]
MSIMPPSVPVLRGRKDTQLQFDGAALILRRRDAEHHIPLAAVAQVRSAGRVVEVELTAPPGSRWAVHRIEDVSEDAGRAFTAAVATALTGVSEPAADGSALVTVRTLHDENREFRLRRAIRLGWLVVILVFIGETVLLTNTGDPELSVMVWMGGLTAAVSVHVGVRLSPFGRPAWRLPKHGVTVMAQYDGYFDGMHVYAFTDLNGKKYGYTPNGYRGDEVEVVYDPRDPFTGTERSRLIGRGVLLLPLIFFGGLGGLLLLIVLLMIPAALIA